MSASYAFSVLVGQYLPTANTSTPRSPDFFAKCFDLRVGIFQRVERRCHQARMSFRKNIAEPAPLVAHVGDVPLNRKVRFHVPPLFQNTPSAILRKAYPPDYLSEVPHAGAGSFAPHAGAGSFAPQAGAGSFVPHAVPNISFAVIASPPFRFADFPAGTEIIP